ncbi:MAG: Gfo/Idh/MocA family oxidoreductase [Armatimonadota bacterium]|nr:Gfo/Idh/MocA family oxidoreductase [bacterium]
MIKVGLVGYGFMGDMHAQCHNAAGESRIVAVVDVDEAKRDKAKKKIGCDVYATIDDMLASADVDMVDICTPTFLHAEHAVAAARAGKHILCEKPMAMTVAECDKMIDAVNKAGVTMMIAQVIRFWPEYQVVKKIVDSGRYGNVMWVSARRFSPPASWAWEKWLWDPKRSGGGVLDLHIHDQDYIAYLLGSPKQVFAQGVRGPGGGLDAVQAMGFGHKSGARSFAEGSLIMSETYPFNMALIVSLQTACIKLDTGLDQSLMVYPNECEPFAPDLPSPEIGASTETSGNLSSLGGYYNEIKYFIECLKANKKPEVVTPEDGREAVKICLAVTKSAETGCVVDL